MYLITAFGEKSYQKVDIESSHSRHEKPYSLHTRPYFFPQKNTALRAVDTCYAPLMHYHLPFLQCSSVIQNETKINAG